MDTKHAEERKKFQIERIIFFTDAIFAIAITLLIIELKVPIVVSGSTDAEFWHAMLELLPQIIGFLISFLLIGLYWYVHHRLFQYLTDYTPKLIWLNLFFLLSIVIMPFSTAVFSEYSVKEYAQLHAPFAVYVANISFTGIMNFVLLSYILNPVNKIADSTLSPNEIAFSKKRALIIPAVFMSSLLLSYAIGIAARFFLFTIPIFISLLKPKVK